jgi:deltex-like protein
VWNSIHHKTSLDGGPHGFPDPNYIDNCNAEMTALGIPPASAGACMRDEVLEYTAPATLSSQSAIADALEPMEADQVAMAEIQASAAPSAPMWYLDDCPICSKMLSCEPCVQVKECSHFVHESCMEDFLKIDQVCPLCYNPFGEPQGHSPSGTMEITLTQQDCPGFSAKAIEIKYRVPAGQQMAYHENPGVPYEQTVREAYLPQTTEGCQILKRFKYAWLHGLMFTIGTSLTTKKPNSVVWALIPHKTSLRKGPFGFPDTSYLEKCSKALDELGVPKADNCT